MYIYGILILVIMMILIVERVYQRCISKYSGDICGQDGN